MTYEKLTTDGLLVKCLENDELYLHSGAGLETMVYAYYLAVFEGLRLSQIGFEGKA